MRKLATLFLLIVSLGLVFAGAVSAEDATTDVTVVDENGDPVIISTPGDEVAAVVEVNSNDETLNIPWVEIIVDPDTGIEFNPEDAVMWDGTQFIDNDMTNYPMNAFFFYDTIGQVWVWDIAYAMGGNLPADTTVALIAPGIVGATGDIDVNADLWQIEVREPVLVDSDSYTFLSVPPRPIPVNGATVPMQTTGAPLAVAALGLLSIIGGAVYGKLR
ncbi:MAG: hypothetical protein LLF83_02040 [Methanobacterium sp.]|nr:hypothetical protein [Methanobacterium sp.]